MGFREKMRDNPATNSLYCRLRDMKHDYYHRKNTSTKYNFTNRSTGKNKCCIILAGYKSFVWDTVFPGIKNFIPEDIDVCVVSSGLYSEELDKICSENNWSYLSTNRNNVSVAQNVAIDLMKDAEFFYKLDEDIFVTDGYFQSLMDTYNNVKRNGEYDIGFVAPLIPINGYGHLRLLKRLGLTDLYAEKFERPIYASYSTRQIECNPDVAEFFWGEGGFFPHIDELAKQLKNDEFSYSACPVRFSIGAILFTRETWSKMGMFPVTHGSGMGLDESEFCAFCIKESQAIIVAENAVVGHLSFGNQNAAMKEYYGKHHERFEIAE